MKKILTCIFLIYTGIRLYLFFQLPWKPYATLLNDSGEYLEISRSVMLYTEDFFRRPIFYPVFLRVFHQNFTIIFFVQLIVSIFAWSFCAYTLSLLTNKKAYKLLIVCSVLIYSFSAYIALWDVKILTESLSISAIVCLLSVILLSMLHGLTSKNLICILLLSTIIVLLKDSSLYLVILVMVALAIYKGIYIRHERKRSLMTASIIILFTGLLFWESCVTANIGKRWLTPIAHILLTRTLFHSEGVLYFKEQGMKGFDYQMLRSTDDMSETTSYVSGQSMFSRWTRDHGKNTYEKFLITHPKHFFAPLLEYKTYWGYFLLVPYLKIYINNNSIYKVSCISVSINCLAYIMPFFFGILFIKELIRKPYFLKDIIVRSSLLGIFFSFVFSLIIWHADAMEIIRHQLETYLFLMFCLFFGFVRTLNIDKK